MADADVGTRHTHRAFSREFKLSVVQWFHSNDQMCYKHLTISKIDCKQFEHGSKPKKNEKTKT